MKNFYLSDVAQMMQGRFSGQDALYQGISMDSRDLQPGDLFIALKGEQTDGHDYVEIAEKQGAAGLIVDRPVTSKVATLVVEDTCVALAHFAKAMRLRCAIPLVAITGSCGKTSIKEMLYSILSLRGPTLATQGNFNNEIGVPLTLARLRPEHWAAIIEMGARRKGDIRYLMSLAQPTVSLISNASMAHVEIFGSLQSIAEAKGEIYENLSPKGIAIINQDETQADFWRSKMPPGRKVIGFALKNKADIYARDIQFEAQHSRCTLWIDQQKIALHLKVPGQHVLYNALAAAAAAHALGIDAQTIQEGLERFSSVSGRLQFKKGPVHSTIIDDTYNANPASMQAALAVLARQSGSKCFIMGDMLELGDQALDYHQAIGLAAKKYGIDKFYGVGKMTRAAAEAFGQGAQYFHDQKSLIEKLLSEIPQGATLLVKGSRGMRMERVVECLMQAEERTQC